MKYSVNELLKIQKEMRAKKNEILTDIQYNGTFICSTVEDIEDEKPDFDVERALRDVEKLDKKIIQIKHALNVFNSTHVIEEVQMTIDEILVFLPIADSYHSTLNKLSGEKQKERINVSALNPRVDYKYANFDVQRIRAIRDKAMAKKNKLLTLLDATNTLKLIELDID